MWLVGWWVGAVGFVGCEFFSLHLLVRRRLFSFAVLPGAHGIELVKVIVMCVGPNNHYMIAHNLLARTGARARE